MSITELKNLREKTGAGILDCKNALQETGNNLEEALKWLKKKGLSRAQKKSLEQTNEGRVGAYVQAQGRIAVLIEVNTQTDFAARAEDFKSFVNQLCQHIMAMNPLYMKREEIPQAVRDEEEKRLKEEPGAKPKDFQKKMEEWVSEVCLLEQPFIGSSEGRTVEDCLKDMVIKLGENVLIRRFVRWELGN